jgi:hypothetical protein
MKMNPQDLTSIFPARSGDSTAAPIRFPPAAVSYDSHLESTPFRQALGGAMFHDLCTRCTLAGGPIASTGTPPVPCME